MIKNVKIMVVERDPAIRRFVADVLEFSVNRSVVSFGDGSAAAAFVEDDQRVDIAICADDLPGIGGVELLAGIKAKWPDTTCILISEGRGPADASAGGGVDSFLVKPFGSRELFDIVQKFVVDA